MSDENSPVLPAATEGICFKGTLEIPSPNIYFHTQVWVVHGVIIQHVGGASRLLLSIDRRKDSRGWKGRATVICQDWCLQSSF